MRTSLTLAALSLLLAVGCARPVAGDTSAPAAPAPTAAPDQATPKKAWAIALHGGAGTIPRSLPEARKAAVRGGLRAALTIGRDKLQQGAAALDVVEAVIRALEDDPQFNAGRGAVLNAEGRHELDASIMDGRHLACGAVAGVSTVRHPISAARRVMTETRHVLLSGAGAETFAAAQGLEQVDNAWFTTERRKASWERARQRAAPGAEELAPAREAVKPAKEDKKGTVGVVVLDQQGHLAAGTSTGGLTHKRWGRVGDSPIVGAGTYADDRSAAVSCTGTGEEFIRHAVAHNIATRVRLLGEPLQKAADHVVHQELRKGDGGVIAVDRRGTIAFSYSSEGMYRAAADSEGRFDVAIWEE
jgi:beta-aspartyl-peptidase (threonine type)